MLKTLDGLGRLPWSSLQLKGLTSGLRHLGMQGNRILRIITGSQRAECLINLFKCRIDYHLTFSEIFQK